EFSAAAWSALDATALRDEIVQGRATVTQAVRTALSRIQALDGTLNAFVEVCGDEALARAAKLDEERANGSSPGPLFGVPVAIKANMMREGLGANCGSRMLEDYRAPYTATFVARLEAAGAILVGTTNMDEFAMGSSGENSSFGPTTNPWSTRHAPGGSSSGSAAAVAAGVVPLALGSDTGGSVRQPAALCGIHGFKPTYGTVSRYGLVAFGSSLDQVAPFARSVRDIELCLEAISGEDALDSTCSPHPPFARLARPDTRFERLRVGLPKQYMGSEIEGLDDSVRAAIERTAERFKELGATIHEVDLPHTEYAIPTYYVVATAEASSNLGRYEGVGYGARKEGEDGSLNGMFAATRAAGFGTEVQRRILLGTYALSAGYRDAWYDRALRIRRLIADDFGRAFEECDLILDPTSPTPAFELGERSADPLSMYLADALTVPVSLAGLPAISSPCGFFEKEGVRLPIGMQLIGPARADGQVLRAARIFEMATDHATERPALATSQEVSQ
ncbi:MAG: Asp-tRNA(Asn)/Glu-tRNA(Gln) amidotransferase subunit GatA, partial [Planctomycetota bacterium]